MAIQAASPTVLGGEFPLLATADFRVHGDGLLAYGQPAPLDPETGQVVLPKVSVTATLVKYRLRPSDGLPERSPLARPGGQDYHPDAIADLYAEAAQDPLIADALEKLTLALAARAAAKGI